MWIWIKSEDFNLLYLLTNYHLNYILYQNPNADIPTCSVIRNILLMSFQMN